MKMTLIDALFAPDSPIKRVFICGKITGDPDYRDKFNTAQKALNDAGYAVMNPAILPSEGFEHDQYMVVTKAMLSICDAVMFLNDWMTSEGAIEELEEATRKGLRAYSFEMWQTEYKRRVKHGQ